MPDRSKSLNFNKKCPKCGHKQFLENSECESCGIVFDKFRDKPSSSEFLYRGQIPVLSPPVPLLLFLPLAFLINRVRLYYDVVLELVWRELTQRGTEISQVSNLIAFFILSALSILMYFVQDFEEVIFIVIFLVWLGDYISAKMAFTSPKSFRSVQISKQDESTVRISNLSEKQSLEFEYDITVTTLKRILIRHKEFQGGIFLNKVGFIWQSVLEFKDGSREIIAEDRQLSTLMKGVSSLAKRLDLKCVFTDESSQHVLPSEKANSHDGIQVIHEGVKTIVGARLCLADVVELLHTLVSRAGFFLFLLIMAGVMIKFGTLLVFWIGPHVGLQPMMITLDISFFGVLSIFRPELDWFDLCEYALVFTIFAYTAYGLLKKKEVLLDDNAISFNIGKKTVGMMPRQDFKRAVFLREPVPMVLMLGKKLVFPVMDLPSRASFISLRDAINKASKL